MYAGRYTCCPPVIHVEYAPHAVLRLEKRDTIKVSKKMKQTDGRTPDRYITLTAGRRDQHNNIKYRD